MLTPLSSLEWVGSGTRSAISRFDQRGKRSRASLARDASRRTELGSRSNVLRARKGESRANSPRLHAH